MVLPHIATRTDSDISYLKSVDHRNKKANSSHALIIRNNNENNLQKCIVSINQFLNQDIIDIRPASLQPLVVSITQYIRKQIVKSHHLDIFIDSYSSQIYIRGNDTDKKVAIQHINKLLSPQHLKLFRYLFICKNIISQQLIYELCNKYKIFFADNFANPAGSKYIEYYLSSMQQSKMHLFLTEIAKIAQSKQPDNIQRTLYILRQAFMHHNINSSMYINLKTLISVLRNLSLFNLDEYDINQHNNRILIEIFDEANFCVPNTQNRIDKVNFIQFAIMLCLNDEERRWMHIQDILQESYADSMLSTWSKMYTNHKSKPVADIADIHSNVLKEKKIVTVSLRIGDDEDTMPLFIGKHGKNVKYIQKRSGLHDIHTSWLIGGKHKDAMYQKHDSITMKGTQLQIEEALRCCSTVLEHIGKWYNKRKLKLLNDAFKSKGIANDLDTFDFNTFEEVLFSIPNINKTKLCSAYKSIALSGDKEKEKRSSRILKFIWGKLERNQSNKSNKNVDEIEELRLIDMVYNYCCSKSGNICWLIDINSNFYCNVTPMIELRDAIPFVPAIAIENSENMNIDNEKIEEEVRSFWDDANEADRSALERLNSEIIDEWYDITNNTKRSKEIVHISDKTAMTLTESKIRQLFRYYAQCTVRQLPSNEMELIGNKFERLKAKSFLIEPLFEHWTAAQNVAYLLGKSGKRIRNIEQFTHTRIEVINIDDRGNVELIIRGLPSHQVKALKCCMETQEVLRTKIPKWSVNGVVGRYGTGLNKLQYISGADIFIEKKCENDNYNGNDREVNVEIIGTKVQKAKGLKLLTNWGSGTLKYRFEKFKLRVTQIPFEKNKEEAEIWVKQILAPYCTVVGMQIMDYQNIDTHKKRSLAYFAYVWVDSFGGKMKAIHNMHNSHDINLKMWNGEPKGTILAPAIPFKITPEEFKTNIYQSYHDVENIEIDTRTKINKYAAYIMFNDKTSFYKACNHNLEINGMKLHTFAAKQWKKESNAYKFDENEYKKEFHFYLQYALDNCDESSLSLQQIPKIYENVCNVPWFESFENQILKLYVLNQLDDKIVLTEEEKESAQNKYFYLNSDLEAEDFDHSLL